MMRRRGRALGCWILAAAVLFCGVPAGAVEAEKPETATAEQADIGASPMGAATALEEAEVPEQEPTRPTEPPLADVPETAGGQEPAADQLAIVADKAKLSFPVQGVRAAANILVQVPCRLLADEKRLSITAEQAADKTAFEACISVAGSGASYRIMRNGNECEFPLAAGDVVEVIQDGAVAVSYVLTINAAYKKTATASDSYNTTTMGPGAAVDGDTATRWGTRKTGVQWLQIDLGSMQKIASYAVCGFNEFVKEFQIQYSDTGTEDWKTIATGGPTIKGTWLEGGFDDVVEARYIRFYASDVTDAKATSIMELEIHTAPSDELSLDVLLDDVKPDRVSVEKQGNVSELVFNEEQNRFVGKLSEGTYRVWINGKDCGKEITVSGSVEDTIRAYTVQYAQMTSGNMELPIWAKNSLTNEKIESGAPVLSGTEVQFEIGAEGEIDVVWNGVSGSGLTASAVYDKVIPQVTCTVQAASVAYKAELTLFIDDLPGTAPAVLKDDAGEAFEMENNQGVYTAALERGGYRLWLDGKDTGETIQISQTGNHRELKFYTVRFAQQTSGKEIVPIVTAQTNGMLVISGTAVEFVVALTGKGLIPAWSNGSFQHHNTVVYDRPIPEITCEVKDQVVVSQGKQVTSSHKSVNGYPLEYIVDGDLKTRWACASTKTDSATPAGEVWVTVDLGEKTAFNQLYSKPGKSQTNHVRLSYSNDNQSWTTIAQRTDAYGETQQQDFVCSFPMVEARYFRLTFLQVDAVYPGIYELQLMQVPQYPVQVAAKVGDEAPASVQIGEQDGCYELQKQDGKFVTELPAGTYQIFVEGYETGVQTQVQAQTKPLDLQLYRVNFSNTTTGVRELPVQASAAERSLANGTPVLSGTEVVYEVETTPFEQAVWSGAAEGKGKNLSVIYDKVLPQMNCTIITVEAIDYGVSILVNDSPADLPSIILNNNENTFVLEKAEDGNFYGTVVEGTYQLWIADRKTRYAVTAAKGQSGTVCPFYTVDYEAYSKGVRTEVSAVDLETGVPLKRGHWIEKGKSVRFAAELPEGMLIAWSGAGTAETAEAEVLYDGVKPVMYCEIGREVLTSRNKAVSANLESAEGYGLDALNDDDTSTVWKPVSSGQNRDIELILDLEQQQAFNRVDWILEQNAGDEVIVSTSDDKTNWTQIAGSKATSENGLALEPQRARYLKLCFRNADAGFAVRELRVLNSEIATRMLEVRDRLSVPKQVMNYDFNLTVAVDDLLVSWASDSPAVIRIDGETARVSRPADTDKNVILTATVSQGRLNAEKAVKVTVEKKSSGGGKGSSGGGSRLSGGLNSGTLGAVEEVLGNPDQETPLLYEDVSREHWAYECIQTLSEMGIVNGKDVRRFEPEAMVTREEFAKMLAVALALPPGETAITFQDVPENAWYRPYVAALVEHGMIKGISEDLFGTGEFILRQDLAVLLDRSGAAEIIEDDPPAPFSDQQEISDYALEGVQRMQRAGIFSGDGNGEFRPFGTTTRAEACKVIYELLS